MNKRSLSSADLEKLLADLPGWREKKGALEKTFTFGTFREAFSFMTRVAFEAEALDHHPDWSNGYNKVQIRLTTHSHGDKISRKDADLARRIQEISWVG